MAFVPVGAVSLGKVSLFEGNSYIKCSQPWEREAHYGRVSMATDLERKSFAKIGGDSKWRENQFVGGFPGGEKFYRAWVEEGMTKEVPDMPQFLQASTPFEESKDSGKKPGILDRLDNIEFFKGFSRGKKEVKEEKADEAAAVLSVTPAEPDIPDDTSYAKYFLKEKRNFAPNIVLLNDKDSEKRRVSVAMAEVTAHFSERFFSKEISGKAPIIDIQYSPRYPFSGSVSIKFASVQGPPTLVGPQAPGETVTKMVQGSGGGLKLEFAVEGEGPVNVYRDPRCVENYQKMFGQS